jgi:hypothetical protein
MDYLIPIVIAVINLATGFYLLWYLRNHEKGNKTVLFWAIALLIYTFSNLLAALLLKNVFEAGSLNAQLARFGRNFLAIWWLVIMYQGTVRLISKNKFWRVYLPIIIILAALAFSFYSIIWRETTINLSNIYAYVFLTPLSIILTILFLILYGILAGEDSHRNIGSLIIALAWLIFLVGSALLPWASEKGQLTLWFMFRVVSQLILAFGLVILTKEVESHMVHHESENRSYFSVKKIK